MGNFVAGQTVFQAKVSLPKFYMRWKDARTKLAAIKATGSEVFSELHSETMDALAAKFSSAAVTYASAYSTIFHNGITILLKKLTDLLQVFT